MLIVTKAFPQAFKEEWQGATSTHFGFLAKGGSVASSGADNPAASDRKALELRVAGGATPGVSGGAEVLTRNSFASGTFSARLRTVDCSGQADVGAVTGLFTFFRDGSDQNGDGLPDNSEIDFEWLCADSSFLFLGLWTDFRPIDSRQRRVFRTLATPSKLQSHRSRLGSIGLHILPRLRPLFSPVPSREAPVSCGSTATRPGISSAGCAQWPAACSPQPSGIDQGPHTLSDMTSTGVAFSLP